FDVPFNDDTDCLQPPPDSIVVPRTPTDAQLRLKKEDAYLWIDHAPGDDVRVDVRNCKLADSHITRSFFKTVTADACGGNRLAPFVPTTNPRQLFAGSAHHRTRH